MATVAVCQFGTVKASPGDIFSSPAPAIGSAAPNATDIRDGDASVSTQTGAVQYGYPIQVPPGRNGAAPSLALSYSSQAPIYGGIAAGWSLSIPEIREDTSQGRLRTHSPEVELTQLTPKGDDRFVSSMAGGRPLIAVAEPTSSGVFGTYRAQNDASFARYERMNQAEPFRWRVYTTGGTIMYFGHLTRTLGCATRDGFAPLTGTVDPFGNEVIFEYESVQYGECRIKQVSWGYNGPASLGNFASVAFTYAAAPQCASSGIKVGSQGDSRTGTLLVTGASKLTAVTSTAFAPGAEASPDHTRVVTLAYSATSESCSNAHSPVRLLTSIQESAWGTDSPRVDLPAVTFEYGEPSVDLSSTTTASTPWGGGEDEQRKRSLGWGFRSNDDRWPTVEAMMLDLDGDGLLDRVSNASTPGTDGVCRLRWQRNRGPVNWPTTTHPQFAPPQTFTLPRLKWNGVVLTNSPKAGSLTADTSSAHYEGCSLNGQVTAYRNSDNVSWCHKPPYPSCTPGLGGLDYCFPGGTQCPTSGTGPTGVYRTYLAYRWLDMDADGLPDLVAAVHGNINRYDIEQGTRLDENNALRLPEQNLELIINNTTTPLAWPACPSQLDRCTTISAACMAPARSCPSGADCTINWATINSCVASAQQQGCHGLIGASLERSPYTRCEGLYPWFIYKNQGNGTIAAAPTIKYQPVPLESDSGDSSVYGPGIAAQNHGILDFDGDGVLDAVVRPLGTNNYWWFVWLGDRAGGFGSKRYTFTTRFSPNNRISGIGTTAAQWSKSSEGLLDIDGDGLPEHWLTSDVSQNLNANIAFHDGTSHGLIGASPSPPIGWLSTSATYAVKPGNDALASNVVYDGSPQTILSGTSTASNRVVDVDHDGRVDVVKLQGASSRTVFFNLGGQFNTPGRGYSDSNVGFTREHVGVNETGGTPPLLWKLTTDLIDLDGNGIAEAAYWNGSTLERKERDPAAAPPRLLTKVHNGRGLHTTIGYASMHDPTAVEQHPELTWSDGRPKASPANQWVIKTLKVDDDFPTTTSNASYFYKNPRHGPDEEGRHSFRGFEEVVATSPSGAKTVQRYGYTTGAAGGDWSGRLVETLVLPFEAPTEVRSIDRTTWTSRELFTGTITTFHVANAEHLTCKNGQTELGTNACTPTSAAAYTRTTSTLVPLSSTTQGGVALLWQPTESMLQSGTTAADGDRRTVSTFALATGSTFGVSTTYRLRPLTSVRQHRLAGTWISFGKAAKTWDATYSAPETDQVWFKDVDSPCTISSTHCAISKTVFDMTTGNVTSRQKPMQHSAGTTSSAYTYDARKLFATTETNELGHQRDHLFEYGTGTKLQTEGPNVRTCTTNCPPSNPLNPVKEQHKIRIDGLGRPIERWDTSSTDGNIYTLYEMERTSYIDLATSAPASMTNLLRMSTSPTSVWRQEKSELDGHGRPIRKTLFAQGSVPNDHVTTLVYRSDGTLEAVSGPDPTANNASTVSYRYGFDSLGRPTSIRRPDALSLADQSGVDIAYDGVTSTVSEVVKPGAGQVAVTKTIADSFGRLVEVHEQLTSSPLTWAITAYTFGPDDLVTTVVDPEAVTTTLSHDFAGRRTQITRHGRSWKYTYDKNGNMVAEQAPGSSNPPITDPDYTTTTAYDALDRPASKVIAGRDLSAADRALFVSGTEVFTWDTGANHKGYLRWWQAYAPAAPTASTVLEYANDNQGRVTTTTQTMRIAGYPSLIRQFRQTYFLFGGVSNTAYYDSIGGSNQTTSESSYDARLLPKQMRLFRTGEPQQNTLAVQTRNVAGLVTKRRTSTTGAMTFVESNWTYDQLGRVVSQVVQKDPGPTQVVRQDLTYFGNDDPKTLAHSLASNTKQFQFGYDRRHQLTSANETSTLGYFTSSYSYGTGGRFTNANIAQATPPPGSEVKPRNVDYQYDDADPERVTALLNTGTTVPYATYTFDAAGNQRSRCEGPTTTPTCLGESIEFVYDGNDQLRRATKKAAGIVQGSEEYWYSNGTRIAVVKRDDAGVKTEMIRFIGDTQAHYDGLGAVTHVYSHLSMGTPVARVDRTGNTTTSVEYQFHGLASNTIAAVADGGAVNASFSYTPFGEVVEAADSGGDSGTAAHPRRFNDKHQDDLTGLAYYGARYYDQTAIGWTQADPLYLRLPDAASYTPRRANLYQFSLHNPLRYLDPDGLDPTGQGKVSATTCMPSSTGSGCAMDSGPAVHDGEKTWLSSGVKDREERERNEAGGSRRATVVPVPEFRGGSDNGERMDKYIAVCSKNGNGSNCWTGGRQVAISMGVAVAIGFSLLVVLPAASITGVEAAAAAVGPVVSSGSLVTAATITSAVNNSRMLSQQASVSLPVVQNYVQRILDGSVAPAIRVQGNLIVDGVHRYIATLVTGGQPSLQLWTAPSSARLYPVAKIVVDAADWGNR